ncbi:hypothetical protein CLCR_07573 [Cladophialophora carrionii]|uniref:Uncharacterized protein n=1 Tax=Cladophialophora carrionii TaxID=86049 RepID=A0A1C1CNV2_9EURO|nr:hypothetical protein CLCR_07573 [Cladophialophora carrionii]
MCSSSKPTEPWDLETRVRLLLLLNNAVALALSFARMEVLFIVVGSILGVSIIFNMLVLLSKVRPHRLALTNDDVHRQSPSLLVWVTDGVGVLAFLALYVCSTIETASRDSLWNGVPVLLMTYASIGTLVACAMHGYMALKSLQKYIRYRQSLTSSCPHCHQELGFVAASIALPPSPISRINQAESSPAPRESFSANSAGENEGDMLILKA